LQYHPGNFHFRECLFSARAGDYSRAPRQMKRKLATKWTREFVTNGVRFLKMNASDEWIEEDFDEIVTKFSQFFRRRRRLK